MPKKPQRNGFWYFMQDYKKTAIKNGREFPGGLKDVQADPECAKEWMALSAHDKASYNNLAKTDKRGGDKKTGLGESVTLVEQMKRERQQYEANMQKYIENSIKEAVMTDTLETQSYYFIHVNYYYTKVSMDTSVDYIPAEFAVVEFSLREGIKRLYHQIIRTVVETGYAREAMEHADKTHKLLCNINEAEHDFSIMYTKLADFLEPGKVKNRFPPLYTNNKSRTIVPCLLQRLAASVKKDKSVFDLYSLEFLFGSFMLSLDDQLSKSSNAPILAESQLEKEAFAWTPDIECFAHVAMEGTGPYCSQSIVTQWVFTLCDYCCPFLRIDMIRGVHCPSNATFKDAYSSLVSSVKSMSIKDEFRSQLKSETGVSHAHRSMVAARTRDDDERRKKEAINQKLTIVDHGAILAENSAVRSSPSPVAYVSSPMRPPKTLPRIACNINQDGEKEEAAADSIKVPGTRKPVSSVIKESSRYAEFIE